MKKTVFTGAAVAIVTPFDSLGKINYDVLGKLIDFQIENKTDAIVICGTSGEASTLDDDEHRKAISFAVERVAGRVPVIAGTGSNDTAYAIDLARFAAAEGADAQLQVTPYYNKTTQRGLIAHFNAVADASEIPVILYNVPSRTGMTITPETYAELAKHDNIVATKEASGNVETAIKIRALCGDGLDIYSGEDGLIVPLLSVGAKGVISVLSNVVPKETHDICQLFFEGKVKESAALQIKYSGLVSALFCETNPIPAKAALNLMGFNVGSLRLPLVDMSDAGVERLKNEMKAVGII